MSGGFAGQKALTVENLSAGYRDRIALQEINLALGEGEFLVLAGPNGSGKTTLLKTMAGLVKPRSGRVLIKGQDISALKNRDRAALLAFLFQENGPRWPFTVEELVSQGRFRHHTRSLSPAPTLKETLTAASLTGFENRPVTELSGGEYQRVLIARALFQEARVLLLDEPANNLDPKYQIMMMELLKTLAGKGISVLMSLHDLNLAALYADRIILLDQGKIGAQGSPAEVLRQDLLEDIYGVPLRIGDKIRD